MNVVIETLGHGAAVEVGGLVGAAQHNGKRGRIVGGPDPGNGAPSPSVPRHCHACAPQRLSCSTVTALTRAMRCCSELLHRMAASPSLPTALSRQARHTVFSRAVPICATGSANRDENARCSVYHEQHH